MMMPVTENVASFVLPIPASPASIPISPFSTINNKLFPPQQVSCHKKQSSQEQPKYEVADIFNLYGEEYRRNHKLTTDQLNVMYAIEHCRTAEYGFHADVCDNCGHIETAYNSCRNRHCPKCQGIAKRKWVEARIDELLPVSYHHATFTLPNQISVLSLHGLGQK
ncbi:MAG: transposase zinc-binding domain-containing protein [Deltaproteobacteria bacterium]|nr:transposase zinc-binding domain-containing protein [Deltaproteobacteria bacterium]